MSHPILNSSGEQLKNLLLALAKDPEYQAFRPILRATANSVREKAFGYNRSVTKRKILKLLREFTCLEIDDITDETGISEKEIRSALDDLVNECKIKAGKRRRWQEPGKHYNEIFYLVV